MVYPVLFRHTLNIQLAIDSSFLVLFFSLLLLVSSKGDEDLPMVAQKYNRKRKVRAVLMTDTPCNCASFPAHITFFPHLQGKERQRRCEEGMEQSEKVETSNAHLASVLLSYLLADRPIRMAASETEKKREKYLSIFFFFNG